MRNHADGIVSVDLFVVPTISFAVLFVFVILGHKRRRLLRFGVTADPTAEWLAQQILEAFPWDSAPSYLVRDRDSSYGQPFKKRLRSMGIRDRPTAPRSPWQNGYAERLIGSVRREFVDHVIVLGERHLRRIIGAYADYYNNVRTRLSLDKGAPLDRPAQRAGQITSVSHVGGLHYSFTRI